MKKLFSIITVSLFCFLCFPPKLFALIQFEQSAGYKVGIFTGRNLYTIFKTKMEETNGASLGIQSNTSLAKKRFIFPQFLENIQGAKIGIITSQSFGENEGEIKTLVGKEIVFLREMYYALTTDIFQYLNKYPEREFALNNHIAYLKNLAEIANERRDRIIKRTEELEKTVKETEKKILDYEKQFFTDFANFKAKNSEDHLQAFIDLSRKQIVTKAYVSGLNEAKKYHNAFLPKLEKRIKAIELNKEALLSGIRVTEVEDVDLGIILKNF